VVCASGSGQKIALLKVVADKEACRAEEVWSKPVGLRPWYDSVMLVGEHLYAGADRTFQCLDLVSGDVVWKETGEFGGAVSMASAEDNLYLLSAKGEGALLAASPKAYTLKGKLKLPGAVSKSGATAPVIAGGRLYLRDDDQLFCYEIKEGAKVEPKKEPDAVKPDKPQPGATDKPRPKGADEPDVVFVPTPQDVVEKMVELASVRRTDLIYDLGCGDGRIVVTAARQRGCRAIGYDIDPQCVQMAQTNVRRHELSGLVTIERRDIFTLDLSEADVVTLYLSPELNERLLPLLAKLKPGARVVSHAFEIPGVPADRVVTVASEEDLVDHKVYVWTAPLKKPEGGATPR
jgi:precorrin-6B methylase 2